MLAPAQLLHAVSESPDARQHDSVGRQHPFRVGREVHPRPDLLQRPRHGERVARVVVYDGDFERFRHWTRSFRMFRVGAPG